MKIKDILKNINWYRLILGIIFGAIGGYTYYYFVGCQSGTCAIQSNPLNMTLYGSGMGAILFFNTKKKENS